MIEKISESRKAAGLSQTSMSRTMGIPLRTIQDWESGKRTCPSYVERFVLDELDRIKKKGEGDMRTKLINEKKINKELQIYTPEQILSMQIALNELDLDCSRKAVADNISTNQISIQYDSDEVEYVYYLDDARDITVRVSDNQIVEAL